METLLQSRNKSTVKTVDCEGGIGFKKAVPSAGKVMATVFWDNHGVILTDYLLKGKIIGGVYYASSLDKLKADIAEKRSNLKKK